MPSVTDMKANAQEMLERMGPAVYERAYSEGYSLSAWLEREMPSDENDGLDAFERLLKVGRVRTRSLPGTGIFADRMDAFDQSPQTRALFPEWAARQWRRAVTGYHSLPLDLYANRAVYADADTVLNTWLRPYFDAGTPRVERISPAIPLSELVAINTPIDGDAYRAWYLEDDPVSERRMVRVAEGAEIPRAKLEGAEKTTRIYKFGRALEVTYEQVRRQRIDRVALHIQRLAVQAEADKVAYAMDVLVNGDGNAGTAATVHNLTALDPDAVAGTLTLEAWLRFKMKFTNPYALRVALAQEDVALQMMLLDVGNANIPLVFLQGPAGFGGFTTINPGLADGVRLGWTEDAPANAIVGFDSRFALERVIEIGASTQEVARWIERQVNLLTFTETEGFAIFDKRAARVLNLGA